MEISNISIEELKPYPHNARIHTAKNLKAIEKSLLEFGQIKNLIVQKSTNYVLAGNGTLMAMKNLDFKTASCYLIEISDDKAKALSLIDNRTTDLSSWDENILIETLQELNDKPESLLDLTGFENEELEKMLSYIEGTAFEPEKPKEKKEKKKKEEMPVLEGQLSFILNGIPFVSINPEQVSTINELLLLMMNDDNDNRASVIKNVFDSIESVLRKKYLGEDKKS